MSGALTIGELRPLLARHGYTHVVTFGGDVALSEWQPYGNVPGGVNYRAGSREWRGTFDPAGYVTDDAQSAGLLPGTTPHPFILGRWALKRASADGGRS